MIAQLQWSSLHTQKLNTVNTVKTVHNHQHNGITLSYFLHVHIHLPAGLG